MGSLRRVAKGMRVFALVVVAGAGCGASPEDRQPEAGGDPGEEGVVAEGDAADPPPCERNAECEDGDVCYGGEGACLPLCMETAQCPSGRHCRVRWDVKTYEQKLGAWCIRTCVLPNESSDVISQWSPGGAQCSDLNDLDGERSCAGDADCQDAGPR